MLEINCRVFSRAIKTIDKMKNIIKGWVTSLLGIAVCYLTYVEIKEGSFSFVWEGLSGFGLGVTLLLAPDDFIKILKDLVKNFTKKDKTQE